MLERARRQKLRWMCGENPSAQPHKGDDERQLQGHDGVVRGLNHRQVQTQGQCKPGAENRGDSDHRNAANCEPERQCQRQLARRDSLAEPKNRFALCRCRNPATVSSTLNIFLYNLETLETAFGFPGMKLLQTNQSRYGI